MTASNDVSAILAQRTLLLGAAARDMRLKAVDVRIAVLLLDQIHRKAGPRFGLMWPSMAKLAGEAGITRRWATECVKRLVTFGYLVPIAGGRGGRSITVSYQMGEPKRLGFSRPETVNVTSHFSEKKCEAQFPKVRTEVPETVKCGSHDFDREPVERCSLCAREGDRCDRCALDEFQPDAAMDDWSAKNVPGVNPRDPVILAKFKALHQSKHEYPKNCTAAYHLWLLRELEHPKHGGRPRPDRTDFMEALRKDALRTDDD